MKILQQVVMKTFFEDSNFANFDELNSYWAWNHKKYFFSDECIFSLERKVSKQNYRYWVMEIRTCLGKCTLSNLKL